MSKLQEIRAAASSPIQQNRMLFDWLRDDRERARLYDELRKGSSPLQFKSLLRSGDQANWPNQDVYLLSKKEHIAMALQYGSVKPYQGLEKGDRFMLGMDRGSPHETQNRIAARALIFTPQEIEDCARAAFVRASVLPLKNSPFDLANLAAQTALRFTELLFGFRDQAHPYLEGAMQFAYTQLVFQIIGRHFVSDTGLPPIDSPRMKEGKEGLEREIGEAGKKHIERPGRPSDTVIERLVGDYGMADSQELIIVALGLIAGTIGNVRAAVSIAIEDFFNPRSGAPLIGDAQEAARSDSPRLKKLIGDALVRNPPAPFLARTSTGGDSGFDVGLSGGQRIPEGAHLLLALGAVEDDEYMFGGPDLPGYLHRCIGTHLAWPLILEIVRRVLLLPGLSQVIDPATGEPKTLRKRWGAICDSYPMQFQRDRLLNLQPLHVVLPIKEPVAENAEKLRLLMVAGAPVVQEALDNGKFVHSAYFMLVEGGTHLAMMTVYDGDFDAYVEHFATDVPLFNEQLQYLADAPPTPTRDYPKQFVEWIRRNNKAPFGNYFYSAYPTVTVADVVNATAAKS